MKLFILMLFAIMNNWKESNCLTMKDEVNIAMCKGDAAVRSETLGQIMSWRTEPFMTIPVRKPARRRAWRMFYSTPLNSLWCWCIHFVSVPMFIWFSSITVPQATQLFHFSEFLGNLWFTWHELACVWEQSYQQLSFTERPPGVKHFTCHILLSLLKTLRSL